LNGIYLATAGHIHQEMAMLGRNSGPLPELCYRLVALKRKRSMEAQEELLEKALPIHTA